MVHAGPVHALREAAMCLRLPRQGHLEGARRHRRHRLQQVHLVPQLHDHVPLWRPPLQLDPSASPEGRAQPRGPARGEGVRGGEVHVLRPPDEERQDHRLRRGLPCGGAEVRRSERPGERGLDPAQDAPGLPAQGRGRDRADDLVCGVSEMTNTPATRPGIKRFIGVDFDVGALGSAGRQYWSFVAVLAIIAGLGVTAWIIFMTQGAGVMAQRDNFTWGMWFSNYMYYVGLSAGGLIVYASVHLFGAEQFRPLARLAVLQAGVLVMLALLGDLTDLIRPWRTYQFLTRPNISAIFIYTGSAAAAYMVLTFFDLWVLITGKGGEKLAKRLTLVALPFAIYLHTTTAFVLSLNKSRELWNSAVMVPIFLTSAIASGIALLLISAYIMQHFGVMKFKSSMFRSLSTLLATVIISDLFLLVVEVITVFWPTSAKTGHVDRMAL